MSLLNAHTTRSAAIKALFPSEVHGCLAGSATSAHLDALAALKPYLALPALLHARRTLALLPMWRSKEIQGETLSDIIDAQRDWVTSNDCPAQMKDDYLVHPLTHDSGIVTDLRSALTVVWDRLAHGDGVVLRATNAEGDNVVVCDEVAHFQSLLDEASGGVLANRAFSFSRPVPLRLLIKTRSSASRLEQRYPWRRCALHPSHNCALADSLTRDAEVRRLGPVYSHGQVQGRYVQQ